MAEDEREGFAGSPTVRIDGRDLEGYEGPAGVACRRYESDAGEGWPSQAFLEVRLRAASGEARPAGTAGAPIALLATLAMTGQPPLAPESCVRHHPTGGPR